MRKMGEEQKNKLSIIVFSGDFDKALAAFVLANGARAFDWEVSLFFTFWGLNIIKKENGRPAGKGSFIQKMFNIMMGGKNKRPLSKFNFAGMGPKLMQGIMKKKNIKNLNEMMQDAISLGVKMYACEMAMNVMGITKEDLIENLEGIVGVASFLANAEGGQIIFI
jgi:peroxiredoxin family protein